MASVSEACVEFLKDDALKKALLDASESGDYRDDMSFRRSPYISVRFPADNWSTLYDSILWVSHFISFHHVKIFPFDSSSLSSSAKSSGLCAA